MQRKSTSPAKRSVNLATGFSEESLVGLAGAGHRGSRLSGVLSATEPIDEKTGTRPGSRTPKLRLLRPSPLPNSARRAIGGVRGRTRTCTIETLDLARLPDCATRTKGGWCPRRDSNAQRERFRLSVSTDCTTGTITGAPPPIRTERIPGLSRARLPDFASGATWGEQGGDACGNRTRFVLLDRQVLGQ